MRVAMPLLKLMVKTIGPYRNLSFKPKKYLEMKRNRKKNKKSSKPWSYNDKKVNHTRVGAKKGQKFDYDLA